MPRYFVEMRNEHGGRVTTHVTADNTLGVYRMVRNRVLAEYSRLMMEPSGPNGWTVTAILMRHIPARGDWERVMDQFDRYRTYPWAAHVTTYRIDLP